MKPFHFLSPRRTRVFTLLCLMGLSSLRATGAESLFISLQSIPDRIRKQNPDLAAARYRIAEALGRLKQSGRHSNPELALGVSHTADFRERAFSVGISQKFPVTNRLLLEKAVSLSSLKAAEAEVLDVERRLIAESKQLMIKALAVQQRKKLIKQQAEVAKQLADYIGNAAAKGEGSVLDTGQAKLEAAQFSNELRRLNAEEAALKGNLKPLLGMPATASLTVGGSLPTINTPTRSLNPNKRPDLKAARLQTKAASKAAELERAKRRDDIELSVAAGVERTEDAPEGFDTDFTLGLNVKIPLPFWNKNEGAIEAADARKRRKQKEASALAHSIRNEAAAAHAEMREWAKLSREISSNLLPLAKKQAELADHAYRNGQGSLQSVLRTREQLLKIASSQLDALREFHLAKVRYQSALAQK